MTVSSSQLRLRRRALQRTVGRRPVLGSWGLCSLLLRSRTLNQPRPIAEPTLSQRLSQQEPSGLCLQIPTSESPALRLASARTQTRRPRHTANTAALEARHFKAGSTRNPPGSASRALRHADSLRSKLSLSKSRACSAGRAEGRRCLKSKSDEKTCEKKGALNGLWFFLLGAASPSDGVANAETTSRAAVAASSGWSLSHLGKRRTEKLPAPASPPEARTVTRVRLKPSALEKMPRGQRRRRATSGCNICAYTAPLGRREEGGDPFSASGTRSHGGRLKASSSVFPQTQHTPPSRRLFLSLRRGAAAMQIQVPRHYSNKFIFPEANWRRNIAGTVRVAVETEGALGLSSSCPSIPVV